jgi:hypothetical protein
MYFSAYTGLYSTIGWVPGQKYRIGRKQPVMSWCVYEKGGKEVVAKCPQGELSCPEMFKYALHEKGLPVQEPVFINFS